MNEAGGIKKFLEKAQSAFSDYEFTKFVDGKGFSLVGSYGASQKRQMGISSEKNIVPFAKFYFIDEELNKRGEYISLIVRISPTFKDESGSQVRYITDAYKFRVKPIELTTGDEFYVKNSTGFVYEKKGNDYKKIELSKLYGRIYKAHISSVFTPAGLYRRLKILAKRTIPGWFFSIISWSSGYIYWWLKGKRFTFDVFAEAMLDQLNDRIDSRQSELPSEPIDFFGYKVGVWTLTTFSIVVIGLFLIFHDNPALKLPSENVLSGVYSLSMAIVAIVLYDKVLPTAFKFIVKKCENKAFNLKFTGVKFKI